MKDNPTPAAERKSAEEMAEIWKDIIGFEGLYQISNRGNVKSIERYIGHNKGGLKIAYERILKLKTESNGYVTVTLCKNNTKKSALVHRLVCAAFHINPENKRQVNHKDGIKTNNHESNLEWITSKGNIQHAFKVLGKKPNGRKLTETDVAFVIKNKGSISVHDLAVKFNVSVSAIYQVWEGKSYLAFISPPPVPPITDKRQ